MYKLLLADDEPLVLVGMKSMLKWEDYDIELCGLAHNGEELLEKIEQFAPDLVVTDIKMPLKSGLDVLRLCREKYGRLPLFILLTSYEEFGLAKEALRNQAVDYLVKLELTPQTFSESIIKALAIVRDLKKDTAHSRWPEKAGDNQAFFDKFFIRLLNDLFENEEQYRIQLKELRMDTSFVAYAACYCEIEGVNSAQMSMDKLMTLYSSTLEMVRETVTKYLACYITSLDTRHFNITFCLSEQEVPVYQDVLREVLQKTTAVVSDYFSTKLFCAVGPAMRELGRLSTSYSAARAVFRLATLETPIVFSKSGGQPAESNEVFDLSQYRESISNAFEELDADALRKLFSKILGYFDAHPDRFLQAMDAACNLLYMAISLLPEGEKTISAIFNGERDGFRCIYQKHSTEEVAAWLSRLSDGLCTVLENRKQNYKNSIVARVQKYIRENLDKRLTLNEVASLFGFSPNYLSQLFTHYANQSFVGYITQEKIGAAKKMLSAGDAKIYEISERLGFENAFYFSKVFKKVEGCSPRDYMQRVRG